MPYGEKVAAARRFTYLSLGAFTANTTVTPAPRFGCPVGVLNGMRIIGMHVEGDAIPSDPDGTMLLNVIVQDVSEAGDDTILTSEDLEVLLTAANRFFEAVLDDEGTENELTIFPGDTVRCTLVSNSAAITTNPNVVVCIEWHLVPDYDDLARIQHPSEYIP